MKKIAISLMVLLTCLLLTFNLTQAAQFSIATSAGTEASMNAAFDGTNYLVGIQGDASKNDNITAQLVSASGALVGPRISVGHRGSMPFVAYDGTNYLLLWQDCSAWIAEGCENIVYGQFISTSGALVATTFPVTSVGSGTDEWGLIFGGGSYFLAYQDDDFHLLGKMISPSGVVGNEISIGTVSDSKGGMNSIGFDGSNFLVVWDTGSNILGRFVGSSSGTTSGSEFVIYSKQYGDSSSSVTAAFDGTNYLVVWHEASDGVDGSTNLYGRLITPSGSTAGERINVSVAAGDQMFPFIAFDGSNYLVTWIDMRNDKNHNELCDSGEGTCWDAYGQYISKAGAVVGNEIPVVTDSGNQIAAVVGFQGGKYFVLVENFDVFDGEIGDVYGLFITPAGSAQPKLTVTVSSADSEYGPGTGKVTSTGISCSNTSGTTSTDCDQTYTKATKVTLKATADKGSSFREWSGCDSNPSTATCVVNISSGDVEVTATFEPTPRFAVTVSKDGNGEGTVKSSHKGIEGNAINCDTGDTDCGETYVEKTNITLVATPAKDGKSKFVRWEGAACVAAKTASCRISKISADAEVTAVFGYPMMTLSDDALDFSAGAASRTFSITNSGTGSLTVVFSIGGIDKKSFRVYNSEQKTVTKATVAEGEIADFEVVFSESAKQSTTATLIIKSNDPDNKAATMQLTGTK